MEHKKTYRGYWHLPESPEITALGTLNYNPDTGLYLELEGEILTEHNKTSYEPLIIVGSTDTGESITLYKTFKSHRSINFSDVPNRNTYIVNFALIGAQFQTVEQMIFHKATARYSQLNGWLSVFGFDEPQHDLTAGTVKLEYKQPEAIKFKISDDLKGQFHFSYSAPFFQYQHKATIESKAKFSVESSNGLVFDVMLQKLSIFESFLTLGLYETTAPISAVFINNDLIDIVTQKPCELEVLYAARTVLKQGERDKVWFEHLYSYADIRDNFEEIISTWYTQDEKLKPVTNILFESFHSKGRFTENNFLNMAQAVETFHRRFLQNITISKTEHKSIVEQVVITAPASHQGWIKEKLSYSYEPTLHERLVEVINEVSVETLTKIIPNTDEFIKTVKQNRNYYTHYGEDLETKALKGEKLFFLSEKLRVILIVLVLLKTGFKKEQVEELYTRNEFKFFNHLLVT